MPCVEIARARTAIQCPQGWLSALSEAGSAYPKRWASESRLRTSSQSAGLDSLGIDLAVGCSGLQGSFGGIAVKRRGANNGPVAAGQRVLHGVALDVIGLDRAAPLRLLLGK